MKVTEVVNSSTDSDLRAQLTLIDDQLVFSIEGVDYAVNIADVERKIEKHRGNTSLMITE